MAKGLTAAAIAALKPGSARREVPDGRIAGLYLVIQPSGAMSWALRYRFGGKARKYTIGPWPAIDLATARKRAQEASGKIAAGVDPAVEKQAAKVAAREAKRAHLDAVEKVVEDFIERHAKPNTRDWKETARILRKDVVTAWAERRLSEIGRADVHALLDQIVDRGAPIGANRTFAQLRKLCNWAVQRGIIDRSPCDGLTPPSAEKARDRVLSSDELALVWSAAETLGFPFSPIVKLLILTGQRRDEIGEGRWNEIDLDGKVWTIPAERSKNRKAHAVPLSDAAIDVLKALPRFDGQEFVFSAGQTPPSGYSKAKPRLDKAIVAVGAGEAMAPWVLHDIRRSVASGMGRMGIPLHVIERCLNHISGSFGGIVGVYQRHSFSDEMRSALDAWARHVDAIATGETAGNVIDLASARA